jgi:hypothetical protein
MRRPARYVLGALALLGALQLVPVDRSNPPVTADFDGPPEVEAVLRQSCYDCHSNETTWTWTAYVAPVSWLVVRDVHRARDAYNLSEWGRMDPEDRAELPREMVEEVEDGEMPLPAYLLVHPEARVTAEGLATLRAWAGPAPGEEAGDEGGQRRRRRGRDH